MVYFRKYEEGRFHRRSTRLKGYDYRKPGAYFVTILAAHKDDFLGTVQDGIMVLNEFGTIAEQTWKELPQHNSHISLDAFVIMPDHVHGIIVIHGDTTVRAGSKPAREATQQPARYILPKPAREATQQPAHDRHPKPALGSEAVINHGLPEIIRQFKTFSARRINELRHKTGTSVWKRNYYESIIHSQTELHRVRRYICNNPVRAGSKPARDTTNTAGTLPVRAGSTPARDTTDTAGTLPVRAGSKPARVSTPNTIGTPPGNAGLLRVVRRFNIHDEPSDVSPIGSGHINDSYLVATSPPEAPDWVLQRINHRIFKDVPGLMKNIETVTTYLSNQLAASSEKYDGLQALQLIPALDGKMYHRDASGNFWRLYHYIPESITYDRVPDPELAHEGGRAFGRFLQLTSGLDPMSLAITIRRFHDISWRMEQFEEAIHQDRVNRGSRIQDQITFVRKRSDEMHTIHRLLAAGRLPVRVTHNDTKFNNILFNKEKKAICIVDLDTVMPGTVLFDFGDAIRTGANTADEDEPDLSRVELDMELFRAYADGYLETAGGTLTETELDHLAHSARFMTFLIGLRFLTDYINGDMYFKIQRPDHNLVRARAQFALLRSMEEHFSVMQACIAGG